MKNQYTLIDLKKALGNQDYLILDDKYKQQLANHPLVRSLWTIGHFFVIVGNTYTFKYDYYWMMGDNRHRSQDSRFWGFVPETHIVGKASLIWFSWNNGPRWDRLFKSIK